MEHKNDSSLAEYLDEHTGDLFDDTDGVQITVDFVALGGDLATVHLDVKTTDEEFDTSITAEKPHKEWKVCYLPGGADHWEGLGVNPIHLENAVEAYVEVYEGDDEPDALMDYLDAQGGDIFA